MISLWEGARVWSYGSIRATTARPHFEDLPLPAEESQNVALQAGANLVFRRFPEDYWSDWHTAPRRQYIFILAGQMEIGIGDGTTRRFGPGDVVLADDLTGQGHTTRSLEFRGSVPLCRWAPNTRGGCVCQSVSV